MRRGSIMRAAGALLAATCFAAGVAGAQSPLHEFTIYPLLLGIAVSWSVPPLYQHPAGQSGLMAPWLPEPVVTEYCVMYVAVYVESATGAMVWLCAPPSDQDEKTY